MAAPSILAVTGCFLLAIALIGLVLPLSRQILRPRLRMVVLVALSCIGVILVVIGFLPRPETPPSPAGPQVAWMFEAERRGAILTTPFVTQDRIYVSALHDTAFRNAGAVYCLDRRTGKQLWRFDNDGKMQHTFSNPCLSDGRLYFGEGMHANFLCKFYCLQADTGTKLWDFQAEGHIESGPCVVKDKVYFAAGDDGVYCLDAVTGAKRWRFSGGVHIDSSPVVSGNRLYIGSGVSRTFRKTEAICLDGEKGSVLWRYPTDLPVWGSPTVFGEDVFFGLGNGRLLTGPAEPDKPAGGVVCLNVRTGERRWWYSVGDAVFGRAAVDAERVYFGSRNGNCYCVEREGGRLLWKEPLGSPIVTMPILSEGRLYVVASGGRVCCLDCKAGQRLWTFQVAEYLRTDPQLFSSPIVKMPETGDKREIFFGAELRNPVGSAAVLFCLRD